MSKQHQAATSLCPSRNSRRTLPTVSGGDERRTSNIHLYARALFGAGILLLAACSDEKPPRQESELQTGNTARSQPADATAKATDNDTATPANQPAGNSSTYSVTAETAYFFDTPQSSKPTGKYLLRGDVIYGEGESNGFVKTRFKNPNGATVTGWLKANELRQLSRPAVAQSTRPPTPTSAQPTSASDDGYDYELDEATTAATATAANSAGTQTAVVQVARSYFYTSPDLVQPRKAHCVQGDKVRLGETQGDAVYVSFTNWEKVTTTGWMRKDALRNSQ